MGGVTETFVMVGMVHGLPKMWAEIEELLGYTP